MALAALLIVDLLRRWGVARDFYSNEGVLPNHFSLFRPLGRDLFSIYHSFSSPGQVHFAFALTLVPYLGLAVGYRTRWMQLLSFLCVSSLNSRNLLVQNGGTVAVNLLCFWTLFLPLGKRFSIDALRASLRDHPDPAGAVLDGAKRPEPATRHYSLATFALLLQWSVVYFFNAVSKSGHGWLDGSALHYFLHQDRIVTAFGVLLRDTAPSSLLRGLTYATLGVEWTLAVLLLVPFRQRAMRLLALLLAVGLHGSIAATARLGPFSYVMVLFFLLPLGDEDWQWLVRRFSASSRGPLRVLYDGDCGICFQISRILHRMDRQRRLVLVPAESVEAPPGVSAEDLQQSVVVVLPGGEALMRQRAVVAIVRALPLAGLGLGFVLGLPGISWIVGAAYRWVAERRHEISAKLGYGVCGTKRPGPERTAVSGLRVEPPPGARVITGLSSWMREALVVVALFMAGNQVLIDNAWARQRVKVKQPEVLSTIVETFRMNQGWRMFAPEPPFEDGRVVVDARTKDGRSIDPLTGQLPDFEPYAPHGWGHDQFWCDFHLKMFFSGYQAYRNNFREYLKRYHRRTGRPEDELKSFDVWWVHDKSPPPGESRGTPLPPIKLLSFGKVGGSLAERWLSNHGK